jgi:hypothetical protein
MERIAARLEGTGALDPSVDDPDRPILLAMSDNGPQMTSGRPVSSWPCAPWE